MSEKIKSWSLVLLLILSSSLLIAFVVVSGQEKTARQEATNALYHIAWEIMKAGASDPSPHSLYRMIPVDARPGFIGYVASWAKETAALADQPVDAFLKSLPTQGIGINISTLLFSQSRYNPDIYIHGVQIRGVWADTPAARAGLCEGDQILEINGVPMNVSIPVEENAFKKTGELLDRAQALMAQNDQTLLLYIARDDKKLIVRISEHNAFEHLRVHEKVLNDWALASQVVRMRLGVEMKKLESLSEAPSNSPIIRLGTDLVAGTLKEVLRSHEELRGLRAQFIENLQPLTPECKNK